MKLGKRKYEKPSFIPKKVKYVIQFCEEENPNLPPVCEKKLISYTSESVGGYSKTNEEFGKLWSLRTNWDTLERLPIKKKSAKGESIEIINDDVEEYVIG